VKNLNKKIPALEKKDYEKQTARRENESLATFEIGRKGRITIAT